MRKLKYIKLFEGFINEKLGHKIIIDENKEKSLRNFIELIKDAKNPSGSDIFYRIIVSTGDTWKDEINIEWGDKNKMSKDKYKEIVNLVNDTFGYNYTKKLGERPNYICYENEDDNGRSLYFWGSWIGFQKDLLKSASDSYQKGKISNTELKNLKNLYKIENEIKKHKKVESNKYYTIDKSPENIKRFAIYLKELNSDLIDLSFKKGATIMWKTKNNFFDLMKHNDSFKIYYYNNSITKDIDTVVNNWKRKYNIEFSTRTHDEGFDLDKLHGNKSYGQLLSYMVERWFVKKLLIPYKNKSTDYLIKYIKDNIENVIKSASNKLNSDEDIVNKLKSYIANYPTSLYDDKKYF